jgi:membrane-bound lytic murein transglycosylase D
LKSKRRISKHLKKYLLLFLLAYLAGQGSNATAFPSVWDVLRDQLKLDHETTQPEVQQQIRWLIAHPAYLEELAESERYMYHIITEIQKRNLPGEIALIPMIESSYDPFAYSGAGAAGLWQLMPGTGNDLGLKRDWWYDGRRSIGASTNAALNYLDYLHTYFNNNWALAIAAYDAGEGTIGKAIKNAKLPRKSAQFWDLHVPQETRRYVPRLFALAEIIKYPDRYHVSLPDIPHTPYFEEVNIGSQIDLNQAAKLAGISYRELLKLNPGFNRWATAPYQPFKLLIPTESVANFYQQLALIPKEKRVSWARYEVKYGDKIETIAKRFFTTIKLLRELNQLHSNQLKQGQRLLIPSNKYITVASTPHPAPQKATPKPAPLDAYKVLHIVQANDTFAALAQKYQVSAEAIKQWNHITNTAPLRKNQQLIIWKNTKKT